MKTEKKVVELYLVLNNAMAEVTRLRKAGSRGPLEDVLDNFDKLVATLMTIREIAGELAELDSERAIVLWVLQDSVTKEILKLTRHTAAVAAGVTA